MPSIVIKKKPTVTFFFRKKQNGNFSIENVFSRIANSISGDFLKRKFECTRPSKGIVNRLVIMAECFRNQSEINHITGDINFIAIVLRKKRTVLTIHDVGFMNNNNRLARFILFWFWIKLPVKRVAAITTVSLATKNELLKYITINPARILVINVPISTLFIQHPREFNKQEPTILQLGTKANKNVLRLVRALRGISCKLEIIGSVDDMLLKELVINRIKYACSKQLSQEEIIEKYRHADIVSFVSTYEGFGLPIVEANAVGRVVVTSNLSSMPEIAGNAAHFVDPFDVDSIRNGIEKVIKDDSYREKLIANGLVNKRRFDVTTIASQYCEIYSSLLKHPTE